MTKSAVKPRVLLFGLTGFGNAALAAMAKMNDVSIIGVVTNNRPDNPFPYYECNFLHEDVVSSAIPLYEGLRLKDLNAAEIIKSLNPDLFLVCSYDQIIPQSILDIPRFGTVNLHPSLLPKYRGATPTVWALLNGESETGITAHLIENEKLDQGRIIAQQKISILPDDTDGSLRQRLASILDDIVPETIRLVLSKSKDDFIVQNEEISSYQRKRTVNDGILDLSESIDLIRNRIRSMTPYPGVRVRLDGEILKVKSFMVIDKNSSVTDNEKYFYVAKDESILRFELYREDI